MVQRACLLTMPRRLLVLLINNVLRKTEITMKKTIYHKGCNFLIIILLISKMTSAQCPTNINISYGSSGQVSFSAAITGSNATATYSWSFGNGNAITSTGLTNNTYTANGTYFVTMTYSTSVPFNNTCTPLTATVNVNTVCGMIFNNSIPNPITACNASASVLPVGFSSGINYNWFLGSTSIGTLSTIFGLCKGTNYTAIVTGVSGPTACASATNMLTVPNTSCGLTASFVVTSSLTTGFVIAASNSYGTGPGMVYSWDFGDGSPPTVNTTSTSAAHTYTAQGNYPLKLVATNTLSPCKDSLIKTIGTCSLIASFISNPGGNGFYSFSSISTNTLPGTTYTWKFGDGTTGSGQSTGHTYSTSGTYSVKLLVNNNFGLSCKDSITNSIIVNVPIPCTVLAGFNFTNTGTPPGVVFFANTSTGTLTTSTYSWNWGDGQNSLLQSPGSHSFATGTYTVSLYAKNSNTCFNTYSQVITVTNVTTTVPCSLTANFSHTVGTSGIVNFVSNSIGVTNLSTYSWDFGDGVFGSGNTPPPHTYLYSGAYNVKLAVIKDPSSVPNCRDSVIYAINITGLPCVAISNFNLNATAIPQYWTATPNYPWNVSAARWDWGDGTSDNQLYTSHIYSAAGNYSICLSTTVSCGATASTCTFGAIFKTQNNTENLGLVYVNVLKPALVNAIGDNKIQHLGCDIYPNPNNGLINLKISGLNSEQLSIAIYNVVGELVFENYSESVSGDYSKTIQLQNAKSGVYFIKIYAGTSVLVKKIVISEF